MNRRPPHTRDRFRSTRIERRERNRRRPDVWGAVRTGIGLLLIVQCLRVAFTSPRLRLQQVHVTGSQRYSAEAVKRIGGIPMGRNIFCVNLVRVAERLEKESVVKDALVTREFPQSIRVELRERVPALQVATPTGLLLADRDGMVFEAASHPIKGLPILQVSGRDTPSVGQPLRPDLVRAVWECDRLARKELLALGKMRVDEAGELWLNIATSPTNLAGNGMVVRVGRCTELPDKFRDIRQSLASVPQLSATAAYLNVMCAGQPSYMRVAAAEGTDTLGARPLNNN